MRMLLGWAGVKGLPLAERASLGGHSEFCPGGAAALATTARGVECLRVPLRAGAAGGFAAGEGFGWGDGEAGESEAVRGVASPSKHFFIKCCFHLERVATKII